MSKAKTEEQRRKNAERSKIWREQNPNYMKEYMKKYKEEHGEEMKENDRRYHQTHREQKNAYRRQWAKDNPEKEKLASLRWRQANRDRIRDGLYRRKYGITLEEYNRILEGQGGGCAICGRREPGGRGRQFHVDHSHETGTVRGILCHACNVGIGLFQESECVLNKALEYIRRDSDGALSLPFPGCPFAVNVLAPESVQVPPADPDAELVRSLP